MNLKTYNTISQFIMQEFIYTCMMNYSFSLKAQILPLPNSCSLFSDTLKIG